MRSLYYGLESGIHPDALFYTQAREFPVTKTNPMYKSISSLEAQIQEDPPGLCLRIQDVILVCHHDSHNREGQPANIFRRSQRVRFPAPFANPIELFICHHVSIAQLDIIRYTVVDNVIEVNWNYGPLSPYHSKCEDCGTEYQVERRTYHGNEQAIVLTRWFNLGPGLSPEDNRWRVLCMAPDDDDPVLDPVERLESPRRTWENGAASLRSLEELTKSNVSFLKGHRFKKVMQQSSVLEGTWEIPPKLHRGKWELASIWKARLNQWKRSPLRTPIGGKSDLEATSGEGRDAS
ncbi:hypothetical protein N7488_003199 [Penicillium malachiteum]|nr:hypothetical protein N7488_003199 [Penicillium malachiteum]